MSIRIGFVVLGVVLVAFTFWTHCAKRLTVDYAVAWSLMGALLVIIGVIPVFSEWLNIVRPHVQWELLCAGALLLAGGMHVSIVLSKLISKNKELSMQISLLNQENEAIKAEIERLVAAQAEADAEKDLIYH